MAQVTWAHAFTALAGVRSRLGVRSVAGWLATHLADLAGNSFYGDVLVFRNGVCATEAASDSHQDGTVTAPRNKEGMEGPRLPPLGSWVFGALLCRGGWQAQGTPHLKSGPTPYRTANSDAAPHREWLS